MSMPTYLMFIYVKLLVCSCSTKGRVRLVILFNREIEAEERWQKRMQQEQRWQISTMVQ